jgi:8-oxo-dGTP pyrophosphatase MutT (NUDIX family)
VSSTGEVQAAGGVVLRRGDDARRPEVLVVHRPHRGDWTLPKGKLEPGETPEEAAVREVEEETGLRCELLERLPSVRYTDHRGRAKIVHYWAMRPSEGSLRTCAEVDEFRWLSPSDAAALLSYETDRSVIGAISAS